MAPQISQQLRERMVVWRYEEHKKASEIALLAGCSESTVYQILCLHHDFGQVNNPYHCQQGQPCTLEQGDMHYIHSILEANPTLYADEIQQQLFEVWDVEVSIATIFRALWRLAIAHKHVAKDVKTIGLDKDQTCDHLLSRLDALPTELPVQCMTTPETDT
jgi:transposase